MRNAFSDGALTRGAAAEAARARRANWLPAAATEARVFGEPAEGDPKAGSGRPRAATMEDQRVGPGGMRGAGTGRGPGDAAAPLPLTGRQHSGSG